MSEYIICFIMILYTISELSVVSKSWDEHLFFYIFFIESLLVDVDLYSMNAYKYLFSSQ